MSIGGNCDIIHNVLTKSGLTYTQYIAMMVLWEHRSVTEKELGKRLYLDSGASGIGGKMELKEVIYRRKSTRSYTGEPVDQATLQKIMEFAAGAKTLHPDVSVRGELVEGKQVKCILPWTTPQMIAIFSEDSERGLVNAGFLFQQVDLYLQSLGLGSCWLGMGKLDKKAAAELDRGNDQKFAILLAFGHPKGEALREPGDFKRKTLEEIADVTDERLEPARLAPSAVNSQPWYFVHEGETIHVYCALFGRRKKRVWPMNRIDMGIALAHLYVTRPETFRFSQEEAPEIAGYSYIGSVVL